MSLIVARIDNGLAQICRQNVEMEESEHLTLRGRADLDQLIAQLVHLREGFNKNGDASNQGGLL